MNRYWKGITAGVTAAALFFGGVAAAELAPSDDLTISGTIRRVSLTEWTVINDAGHTPVGIDRVELKADRVRVFYTFRADKVGSLQVTPDDAFAAAGVRVGASVGFGYSDIFFYMGTSQRPINPGLLSKRGANVWLTGNFR